MSFHARVPPMLAPRYGMGRTYIGDVNGLEYAYKPCLLIVEGRATHVGKTHTREGKSRCVYLFVNAVGNSSMLFIINYTIIVTLFISRVTRDKSRRILIFETLILFIRVESDRSLCNLGVNDR